MKIHELITETAPLAELCERLAKSDFVCVDTEFMRENTYWPELCLVQIGNEEEAAAIDPLAEGIDLTPLWDLMCDNDEVLKVFHAGGQDVEIVYNFTGKTPHTVTVGTEPSISLSVTWRSHSSLLQDDAWAMNGLLARCGVRAPEPGVRPWVRAGTLRALRRARLA